jgi:hypothetical protein
MRGFLDAGANRHELSQRLIARIHCAQKSYKGIEHELQKAENSSPEDRKSLRKDIRKMGQEIAGNIQQSFRLAQQSPTGTITRSQLGSDSLFLRLDSRPAARVAKREVTWPERTVMKCPRVYDSSLIEDGSFHTKSPTMH